MATIRDYRCTSCLHKADTKNLFELLRRWGKQGGADSCPKCQTPLTLKLEFPFAFGTKPPARKVLGVFTPKSAIEWRKPESDAAIGFHPFLIIGERVGDSTVDGRGQTAWLPYWHTDTTGSQVKRKYGQWAPHMDVAVFTDLLRQAHSAGFLPGMS